MNEAEWLERVQEFVEEIEDDRDLHDASYIDVLDELSSLANSAADTKREELRKDERLRTAWDGKKY